MVEVSLEELLTWENFTVSLSMITESRMHSFIPKALGLAQDKLACLMFCDFVLHL